MGVGDLPAEADGGSRHRVQRPPRLAHAEARRLAGDADVGALQQLGATGDGDALDRREQRLRRLVVTQQALVGEVGILRHARRHVDLVVGGFRVAGHGPQVGARAEVAVGAGEDDRADVVVGARLDHGVVHAHEHRPGERVEALRAVHGDDHRVAVSFDECVGHRTCSPLPGFAGGRTLPHRYMLARKQLLSLPVGGPAVRTPICDRLGIELPIFAFSHCRDVVAAVSKAGGYGVLGALAYSPDQLEIELSWIDDHVDGMPYGVDFAMPAKYVGKGGGEEASIGHLHELIPPEHQAFVEELLAEHGVPPLPEDVDARVVKAAGLGVDEEGPGQVEVALVAPGVDGGERARAAAALRRRAGARARGPRRRTGRQPPARGTAGRAGHRRDRRPGHRGRRPLRRRVDHGARARGGRRGRARRARARGRRHRARSTDGGRAGAGRPRRVDRFHLAHRRRGRHEPDRVARTCWRPTRAARCAHGR